MSKLIINTNFLSKDERTILKAKIKAFINKLKEPDDVIIFDSESKKLIFK